MPPATPLVFVVGHTHKPELTRSGDVTIVNGGSIGGGGTGNLSDEATDVGLARLSYRLSGGFEPLAADLVGIDPGSGAATARRERLDEPAERVASEGDGGTAVRRRGGDPAPARAAARTRRLGRGRGCDRARRARPQRRRARRRR